MDFMRIAVASKASSILPGAFQHFQAIYRFLAGQLEGLPLAGKHCIHPQSVENLCNSVLFVQLIVRLNIKYMNIYLLKYTIGINRFIDRGSD